MTRRGLVPLAVFLAAGAAVVSYALLSAASSDASQVPACVQEDSAGPCVWDAQASGNGQGRSFWVDSAEVVHYTKINSEGR